MLSQGADGDTQTASSALGGFRLRQTLCDSAGGWSTCFACRAFSSSCLVSPQPPPALACSGAFTSQILVLRLLPVSFLLAGLLLLSACCAAYSASTAAWVHQGSELLRLGDEK